MELVMPESAGLNRTARKLRVLFLLLASLLAPTAASGEGAAQSAEVFEFGDFALFVPANVPAARGILLALGGPDTRAFITDGPFGAPRPELEASLHVLGQELRDLASNHGLAMLGTTLQGVAELPNQLRTDELIFEAIGEAATASERPEIASAPIFVYGISGGTPEAIGFAARNPDRLGALLLKVPAPPQRLSSAEALSVPTYMILAENDIIGDNKAVIAAFEFNRNAGGLWALAVEPGVSHHSLTPSHRALTLNWLRAIVDLRLGASAQDPLRILPESSGWLGHPDFGVSSWADYPGDRGAASWFPNRNTAEEWWAFTSETVSP